MIWLLCNLDSTLSSVYSGKNLGTKVTNIYIYIYILIITVLIYFIELILKSYLRETRTKFYLIVVCNGTNQHTTSPKLIEA